mgnify:CR=1 FL=1
MTFRRAFVVLAAAIVVASPALATDWIYQRKYTFDPNAAPPQPPVDVRTCAYPTSSGNFCQAGLMPVMVGGVVSCGTPNAGICETYTASRRVTYRAPTPKRRVVCPVGEKGCYTR